jgi:hypothetical protein
MSHLVKACSLFVSIPTDRRADAIRPYNSRRVRHNSRRVCHYNLSLLLLLIAGNFVVASPALALWTIHEDIYFRCPLSTKETKITDSDKVAIRIVIQNQIEAFRAGDGERAFSYASSGVKEQFNTPSDFFNTLKSAYDSVLVPRSMVFEDLKQVMGIVTQPVLFFASDGDTVIASYVMEKEETGDWKISGCYLAPIR